MACNHHLSHNTLNAPHPPTCCHAGRISVSIQMFPTHTQRVYQLDRTNGGFLQLAFPSQAAGAAAAAKKLKTGQRVRMTVAAAALATAPPPAAAQESGADEEYVVAGAAAGRDESAGTAALGAPVADLRSGQSVDVLYVEELPVLEVQEYEGEEGEGTAGPVRWAALARTPSSGGTTNSYNSTAADEVASVAAASAFGSRPGEQPEAAAAEDAGPRTLRTLTAIINNCNGAYPVSIKDLSGVWFTNEQSLAAWFRACSYDTVALAPGPDNRIVQTEGVCVPMAADNCPDYKVVTNAAIDALTAADIDFGYFE